MANIRVTIKPHGSIKVEPQSAPLEPLAYCLTCGAPATEVRDPETDVVVDIMCPNDERHMTFADEKPC